MINIIKQHLAHYPMMQIRDAAKLLYQSEFGGGHMIADPEKSLTRIQEEYASLDSELQTQPAVIESIGNGMRRIYLSALSQGLSPETMNYMFVQSANHKKGSVSGLEEKIEQFKNACHDNTFPFSEAEATAFFDDWKAKDYPAISHSEIYRHNYRPAYRVIETSLSKIYDVVQNISTGMKNRDKESPFVIAIDGMSGSGKTTLGELLHKNFPDSNLFHMDDYFLQPHQRSSERLSEIGGNVDYERFNSEILSCLNNKNGLTYQKYDCCCQNLAPELHVSWKPLVIVEGAYSQHPYFENPYAIRIFCEISKEEQRIRILKRNGKEMLKRFENEWIPKENQYFETFNIKEKSGFLL